MNSNESIAIGLVLNEASCIDEWQWTNWSDLYADDAVIWAPTWLDETTLSDDPLQHVAHFYLVGKPAIEDRVWRIQSGLSPFSTPLPRTLHQVTNFRVQEVAGNSKKIKVLSNWVVFTYRQQKTHILYGRYEHLVDCSGNQPKIASKKIVLLNDYVDIPFDLNNV